MKRRGIYILTSLIFLVSGHSSFGQKVLYPVWNPPDVRFDNFLIMQGEAGTTTTSLLQDRKGFIWCGNES